MATNNDETTFTRKNFWLSVEFHEFAGAGMYQITDVRPDTEYTGDPKNPGKQKRDVATGLLQWKIGVVDQAEPNPRRASYEVLLLSDTEPVPPTQEIAKNMRPIELTGMQVQPRIGGQGDYRFLTWAVRATGYGHGPVSSPSGRGGGPTGGSGASKSSS
ncbi:hypothetical protein [Nocardia terpenica]|uniref:Plasmid replication, integration and excision activator n=1 Tax=Nocardia terpenica TaxID=455432 RepID=A0A291RP20_9NOCA|nr:hypothetical protein [Nocardia terpenica]ATL69060.1 hypothetical protein CRH09_25670 [Nocardia terpenica]